MYGSASTNSTKHATSQLCPESLQPGAASFASQNVLSSAASCGQSPAKQFLLVRMKAAAACARSGNLSSYTWTDVSGKNRFNDFTSLEARWQRRQTLVFIHTIPCSSSLAVRCYWTTSLSEC